MIKRLIYFISVLMLPSITLAYFVSFTTPMTGSSYNVGQTVTLEWSSDIPGNYGSIILYQNGTTIQTINSNFYFYYGTQSYSWTIPSSVPIGSDYQIKLIVPDVGGFYSSTFSINSSGTGASGHSLSFDGVGVDDYVSISHNSMLNISGADSSGTIMAYVKLNSTTDDRYQRIISKKENWSDAAGYELELNPSQNIITFIAGNDNFARGSFTPSSDWIQIAVTFNGNVANVYVNGVDVTIDGAIDAVTENTVPLYIGNISGSFGGGATFNGNIDEVAIWNDDLTAMEVAALYNSGSPIPASTDYLYYTSSSDLVGYWQMNEGSGTYITDASGNGNTGTIYGAIWSTDTPGWPSSYSIY